MRTQLEPSRLADAATEFNTHTRRSDGAAVIASLDAGLSSIRRTLLIRLHEDVEKAFGVDSIMAPVSFVKTAEALGTQIELYQIAESAAAAAALHLAPEGDWYTRWLTRLRFDASVSPEQAARLLSYGRHSLERRRLEFSDILATTLPESTRAPLVLLRLVPLAMHIVTAIAFGQLDAARAIRHQQISELPAIEDCRQCHGKVLDNGEECQRCGNPLWTIAWMTTTE